METDQYLIMGRYDVDPNGVVTNTVTGKVMRPYLKDGYPCVVLSIAGIQKNFRVHRLVAEKYLSNPNGYTVVNHKDRDRSNCHLNNLEWSTQKRNCIHAASSGGHKNRPIAYSKITFERATAIRDLTKVGYTQSMLCRIFNVSQTTISFIQSGKKWKQNSGGING